MLPSGKPSDPSSARKTLDGIEPPRPAARRRANPWQTARVATLETLLVPLGRRTPAHLKKGALHLYLDVEVWAGPACVGFVPVYLSPPTRSQRGFNLASALSDRLSVDVSGCSSRTTPASR